eukprot:TRINITY_DN95208_c0_g1_i1.p1 TRINITY_DN95208_c0_g1~~TRINITY_DN95208_c0_g1_i1.p1  ORF type:complete len:506 (+),score=47.01 TRINITY_DN95208_c0_g1_i1:66-1583(+)
MGAGASTTAAIGSSESPMPGACAEVKATEPMRLPPRGSHTACTPPPADWAWPHSGTHKEPAWCKDVEAAAEALLKALEDGNGRALNPRDLSEGAQILGSRAICKHSRCRSVSSSIGQKASLHFCANGCGRRCARGHATCCRTCSSSGGCSHGSACEERTSQCAAPRKTSVDSTCSSTGSETDSEDRRELCRFAHPSLQGCDYKLWNSEHECNLCSPASYSSSSSFPVARDELPWFLLGNAYQALGPRAFIDACYRHISAVKHFKSREGARIISRGLPLADELQAFALKYVEKVWGSEIIKQDACQEYLDRSGQIVTSRVTDSQYSPPSRGKVSVGGGPKDQCNIARIIKIGLNNDQVDFEAGATKRDTAWHGLAARGLHNWRESGPRFRADKARRTAHGGSVYCTPAFEHAIAYSFRGAVSPEPGKPPFAAMTTRTGEKWNFTAIMQLAIYGRGSAVQEKHQTFGGAPDDGWDRNKIEWVVHDVSKAQIYGILFCFFPDDQLWEA